MAGSVFGDILKISTWGESHGPVLGVVVDGLPAGIVVDEEYINTQMNRRKPGQTKYATPRPESDNVEILSGVFEGKTTGAPISMMIKNTSQRSGDYSEIASYYRPGHADKSFDEKYGFRDYRGGGRSSGRETAARVAAGALAGLFLKELGIEVTAYTKQIGTYACKTEGVPSFDEIEASPLRMPDKEASDAAEEFLTELMEKGDSAGGIIECIATGVPVGLGDPVFSKLDALLAGAVFSIGAVKGVEIGDGFDVAAATGSFNNDAFLPGGKKATNHSGGILGGISDGSDIILRAAIKPTPSISKDQMTVDTSDAPKRVSIKGRHDPVIVPRAVVVVESMVNLVLADRVLVGTGSKLGDIVKIWKK
ncbi:MAG: chorismate synthase [Eubacterium sp.]|nr:chorismate synthase [Eubacterium sp.]